MMNMNESHTPFYGAVKFEEVNIIEQIHPKSKLFQHKEDLCVCYLLFTPSLRVLSSQ